MQPADASEGTTLTFSGGQVYEQEPCISIYDSAPSSQSEDGIGEKSAHPLLLPMPDGSMKEGRRTARVLASLAICVFSGFLLWVFRRGKKGKKQQPPCPDDTFEAAALMAEEGAAAVMAAAMEGLHAHPPTQPQPHTQPQTHTQPIQTAIAPTTEAPHAPPHPLQTLAHLSEPPEPQPHTQPQTQPMSVGSMPLMGGTPPQMGEPQPQVGAPQPQDQQDPAAAATSAAAMLEAMQQLEAGGTREGGREAELRESLQRVMVELASSRSAVEEAVRKGQEVEAERDTLATQLEQRLHDLAVTRAECQLAKAGRARAEEAGSKVREREELLASQLSACRGDLVASRAQVAGMSALHTTNSNLAQRVKELEAQVEALLLTRSREGKESERQKREAREVAEGAVTARLRAETERDKIKERSSEALRKVATLQAETVHISTQLNALRAEREELRNLLTTERGARHNVEAALTAERQRCRGLEVQCRAAQEALRAMDGRLRGMERRVSFDAAAAAARDHNPAA